jgi:hypothetical protein
LVLIALVLCLPTPPLPRKQGNALEFKAMTNPANLFAKYEVVE